MLTVGMQASAPTFLHGQIPAPPKSMIYILLKNSSSFRIVWGFPDKEMTQ